MGPFNVSEGGEKEGFIKCAEEEIANDGAVEAH
jgi:hypothetical protein